MSFHVLDKALQLRSLVRADQVLENHVALVHTAAASNLGQMLNRLCLDEQVPLVNIVRKAEQANILRAAGAAKVCNSTSPTFMSELTDALESTSATLAFDAVGGGKLASQVLTAMEAAANAAMEGYSRYGWLREHEPPATPSRGQPDNHLRQQLHRRGVAFRGPPTRRNEHLRPASHGVEVSHHPKPLT